MASKWAEDKARERFRETGMDLPPDGEDVAARNVGAFLDRIRSEVLEEAAAAADAVRDRYDAAAEGPGVNEAQECADAIRAMKHTEDTSDG